jgi:predicted RNA binding protein YcfA (HicA-like mRNA interferase family)
MTYREVVRRLAHLGCREIPRRGGGSHRKWFNPATQRAAALPDWGSRDIKLGILCGPSYANWQSNGMTSNMRDGRMIHILKVV